MITKKISRINPKTKDVLILLGAGALIAASFLLPGIPMTNHSSFKRKLKERGKEWKKFNQGSLRKVLKRLYEEKAIAINEKKNNVTLAITDKGKRKLLSYEIDKMQLLHRKWDGKWRIIVYDIDHRKRQERNLFQKTLKQMNFYQLQKSIYLTPYPCQDEIAYLREMCDVGREVLILTVSGLENEQGYKEYFGLN